MWGGTGTGWATKGCAVKLGAAALVALFSGVGCLAGQLRLPFQITVTLQPPAVVCVATTHGLTTPTIICSGDGLRSENSGWAQGDYGEFSSRLVATRDIEYIETTVSW